MDTSRTIFIALTAILSLVWFSSNALACSCADIGTVDKEFARSKNVAILKAVHIEKAGSDQRSGYDGVKWTKLRVEKVYKGDLTLGQELTFFQGGGADCIWTFSDKDLDKEFLFYLGTDLSFAGVCTRSRPKKWAAADINYLDNLKNVRGRTRISGIISQYFDSAVDEDQIKYEPLKNHTVWISGNGKNIRARTDENGVYEVYGLPPGQYRIEPEKLKGYLPQDDNFKKGDSSSVDLPNSGQAEMSFSFRIHNSVRGRLLDSDGLPLEDVRLNLIPAKDKPRQYFVETAYPKKDGSFEFEDIPAGTYVIVGNPKNEVTAEYPYPRFYSSGTDDRKTAEEITIGPGQFINGFTIRASRPSETVTVKGRVLFSDDMPVSGESVKFASGEGGLPVNNDPLGSTDTNGNFVLRILKGQKGIIYAYLWPNNTYTWRKCLDKIETAKANAEKDKDGYLLTNRLRIDSAENRADVVLKFPFSLCKQ